VRWFLEKKKKVEGENKKSFNKDLRKQEKKEALYFSTHPLGEFLALC